MEQAKLRLYANIFISNTGDCNVYVNNNILLLPGDAWKFETRPDCIIGETTSVKFEDAGLNPKVIVEFNYFAEIK